MSGLENAFDRGQRAGVKTGSAFTDFNQADLEDFIRSKGGPVSGNKPTRNTDVESRREVDPATSILLAQARMDQKPAFPTTVETLERRVRELELQDKKDHPNVPGTRPDSWEYGALLAAWAAKLGPDDNSHLIRLGVDRLRKHLPEQPNQREAGETLMRALITYGATAVAEAKHHEFHRDDSTFWRKTADQALTEASTLAQKYGLKPEQLKILEEQAINSSRWAQELVRQNTLAPNANPDYRLIGQTAIDRFDQLLQSVPNQTDNSTIARKSYLESELGRAETLLVDFPKSEHAAKAEKHYEEALKLLDQYDPAKEKNPKAATQAKERDQIDVLGDYIRLLEMTGNKPKLDEMRERQNKVLEINNEHIVEQFKDKKMSGETYVLLSHSIEPGTRATGAKTAERYFQEALATIARYNPAKEQEPGAAIKYRDRCVLDVLNAYVKLPEDEIDKQKLAEVKTRRAELLRKYPE